MASHVRHICDRYPAVEDAIAAFHRENENLNELWTDYQDCYAAWERSSQTADKSNAAEYADVLAKLEDEILVLLRHLHLLPSS